jgi:hypothetical protein
VTAWRRSHSLEALSAGRYPLLDIGGEIVGDGDGVAAEICLALAEPVVVQRLQPSLGALAAPGERALLDLVGRAPVVREELRIDEAIGEVAVEVGFADAPENSSTCERSLRRNATEAGSRADGNRSSRQLRRLLEPERLSACGARR